MKIGQRLFSLMCWADTFGLECMLVARVFVTEWTSISGRSLERGMILVYLLGACGFSLSAGVWWLVLVTLFAASWMWIETRDGNRERLRRMFSVSWVVFRVMSVAWAISTVSMALMLRDRMIFVAISQLSYAAFHFAVSLPDGGEPGRRRKLAMDKVKALFGTSWMPAPQGAK